MRGATFAALTAALLFAGGPARADKKSDADLARARQRIQALEREVAQHEATIRKLRKDDNQDDKALAHLRNEVRERERRIDQLEAALRKVRGEETRDDRTIGELRNDLRDRDKRIDQLEASLRKLRAGDASDDKTIAALRRERDALRTASDAPIVHAEFFRLNDPADAGAVRAFLDQTPRALAGLAGVRSLWVGRGAGGEAQAGFVATFDTPDARLRFLNEPAYLALRNTLGKRWTPSRFGLERE